MKTKVVFKILEGNVIALFPDIRESGNTILSYMHIGQHSAAARCWLYELVDATVAQYSQLKKELISIGYDLQLIN